MQVFLQFLLTFIAYGIRVNLSVGIVAMTTQASENPDIPVPILYLIITKNKKIFLDF